MSENIILKFNNEYAEGTFKEVPVHLTTDKKSNVAYWEGIEEVVYNAFLKVAASGGIKINELHEYIDIKELTESMTSRIEKQFPEASFPYVDEDY
jgi:3-keto-L-gulonate-6-phosphate decarboxylase